MGKRKLPANQVLLDFSIQQDRTLLHLGQVLAQREGERLFKTLRNGEWLLEPAGNYADVSSAQDIVKQLGRRLPYPAQIKVAQLHGTQPDFMGFSALFQQKGWVFVNANANEYERYYYTALLTASLGLAPAYPQPNLLAQRAEKLVFETFLPEREVETFFHKGISKFQPAQALDIADFFRLPFGVVLKRALQLEIITDEQYRSFMTVKTERPEKLRPLFVSKSGELEGDFWDNEL